MWVIRPTTEITKNKNKTSKLWAKCMSCPFPVLSLYHWAWPDFQDVPPHPLGTAGCESRCQGSAQESVVRNVSLGPQIIRAHRENLKLHKEMYHSLPRGNTHMHLNFSHEPKFQKNAFFQGLSWLTGCLGRGRPLWVDIYNTMLLLVS